MASTPAQPPTTPPQPSKNWPTIILLLLAAGGPPLAAGFAFAEQITQHPWKALGLALLYELVVVILGFVSKVWQKLESKWVEKTATWVDTRLQELFSRYRKRYLQHLIYRHRDFDVKGLSTQGIYTLELERVFVELAVLPQPPHKTSADPIRPLPEELCQGRRVIWDYLRSDPLAGQNLSVIGPPGCGKTTVLKHMALILTAKKKQRQQHKAPDKLPILLFLRDHASVIKENPELPLAQAVQDSLVKQSGPPAPQGWFARQLNQGRCLVMLDGLDEVADPDTRKQVVAWVERQMTACHQNRFVVTSRPHGYRTNPLGKVTVLEVAPFNSDQVRRFVHNWYLANEIMSAQKDDPGVRMKAREGGQDLLRRIQNTPSLSALAVNPLLLTMIANVHRYRSSLPGRRVELYAEICQVFLGKRQASKGLEADLTPAQKQYVLQPLAYQMMCDQKREIPLSQATDAIQVTLARASPGSSAKPFLKMIENTSGLLVERESGVYGFAHLTFQEYLAAVHVQEERLEDTLIERVSDTWWHETIRLYTAQADATPVIQACLAGERPAIPALTLAIECLEEARTVQPQVRAQLQTVLAQGIEDKDPERRCIIAEALLALRLHRLVRISADKYIDPTPITHAEYQLFLNEQRVQGKYCQPDHWLAHQFPEGQGRKPVIGMRFSDAIAFCKWLTQRETGPWCYRLPGAQEDEMDANGLLIQDGAQARMGYWCASDDKGPLVISRAAQLELPAELLSQQIDIDLGYALYLILNRDGALVLDLTRDRALNSLNLDSISKDFDIITKSFGISDLVRGDIWTVSLDNLDLDRILDLVRPLIHDHKFTLDLGRALVHALDLTRDRAGNLALALKLDCDHDLNLRIRVHDSDLIRNFDLIRDLDFASNLDLNLDRGLDLVRTFARAIDLAHALGRALTLAHDQIRARAYACVLDLDHDRGLTLDSDQIRARADAYARTRAYARTLTRTLTRINVLDGNDIRILDPDDLDHTHRALTLGRALTLALDRKSQGPDEVKDMSSFLHWYIRLSALMVASALLPFAEGAKSLSERLGIDKQEATCRKHAQQLINAHLDLYIDFAILQARINGQLPAFEGIRIVKERIKDQETQP